MGQFVTQLYSNVRDRRPHAHRVANALALCAAIAIVLLSATPSRAAEPKGLKLGARLRAAGRGECAFVRVASDPFSHQPVRIRGRLSLELPDRARLEFPTSGERITLRGDGGEWLQPRLRQLIVFREAQAQGARRWWQLLMEGHAPGIELVSQRGRVLRLRSTGGAGPDSARLEIDGRGLPQRLVVPDSGGELEYRFSGWSFGAPRGAQAFTQHAPAEYERVELP